MTTFPNELLANIIELTDEQYLVPYLFVCKFTFQLVRQRVYKKVIFPKDIQLDQIKSFCQIYGLSIETMILPLQLQKNNFPNNIYILIFQYCPLLTFIQTSIYPNQALFHHKTAATCSFMITHNDTSATDTLLHHNINHINCCSSYFIFPNAGSKPTLTQISHYFHHPGALSNAILPTFGPDLLSLTLNPYDVLTSAVSRLIVAKCPRLRYLVVPSVKAEGLWMLLRWCHTLATIIVGFDSNLLNALEGEEQEQEQEDIDFARRSFIDIENKRAVETIQHHKRVWCIHSNETHQSSNSHGRSRNRISWHIGIIPKS